MTETVYEPARNCNRTHAHTFVRLSVGASGSSEQGTS
jgi:hypothetical protein